MNPRRPYIGNRAEGAAGAAPAQRYRAAARRGPLVVVESGEYVDCACAICGAQPCVLRVSRAITPDDALDALYKTGVAGWTEVFYLCAGHVGASGAVWTTARAG